MADPTRAAAGPLDDALRAASHGPAMPVGFAVGPALLGFFILRGGTPEDSDGNPMDLSSAYDVRIMTAEREHHWWWDQRGRCGRRAVLDDALASRHHWERLATAEGSRLLRGSVIQTSGSWSLLHDGHSRPMWVPVSAQEGAHVRFGCVEYLSTDDPRDTLEEHGNLGVIAERLTTLTEVN